MLLNAEPKAHGPSEDTHLSSVLEAENIRVKYVLKTNWFGVETEYLEAVKGISLAVRLGRRSELSVSPVPENQRWAGL